MSFAQPFADYEILARIGSGAMGTVFKARQKKLNRVVALKVLRPSLARDTHYVDRLRREARIVASLNHPNIVAGYDLGEEGGYHFFVMEYFDGPSLRTLLSEWGMFPEEQVLDTAIQVVEALDHAYRKGVIHRDIKPGNILIDRQGKVKLTDMGLAKGPTDLALTRDGATVGTPQYISPEQARNPQECDIRSDLYSLGATLYHMATGQTPFPGDSMAQVITKVLHEKAASATDLNPKLSDGLSLVIRKLMAKDPDLRYQTPGELLDDLHRVQRDEDPNVDLQRLEAADASRRAPSVRRRLAAGLALVVIIAGSVWVGSMVRGGGEKTLSAQEFSRQLERELAGDAYRDQLAVLARAEAVAANAEQKGIVAEKRREVLAELAAAMNEIADRAASDLESWVQDPLHWVDTAQGWEQGVFRAAVQKELGYRELPDGVSLPSLERARDEIHRLVRARDERFLEDIEQYLDGDEGRGYRTHLGERDYAAAEESLAQVATVRETFRGLSREQVPESLRREIDERVDRHLERARREIEDAEEAAIQDLEESLAGTLDQVERDLRDLDRVNFTRLRESVGGLKADLRRSFPPPDSFRPGKDPWPRVDDRIAKTLEDVSEAEESWQGQHLDSWLSAAYRTLAERGDFDQALQLLDSIEEVSGVQANARLEEHREVLRAARAVAEAVLATLAEVPEPLVARRRVDPNRELSLVVRAEAGGGGFRVEAMNPGGTIMARTLVELHFSDLLEQALARRPDLLEGIPRASWGTALCLFMGGQSDMVVELSPEKRRFFVQDLERVFLERDQALSGEEGREWQQLKDALDRAREDGELAGLRARVEDFRRRFPAVLQEKSEEFSAIEAWLDLSESLRSGCLPGARITVEKAEDPDILRATVTYPAEVLGQANLPAGWSLTDGSLDFGMPDVSLVRARELRLAVEGLPGLPEERGHTLTALLEFPPGDSSPLWVIECDGIALALGLLADNSVVAAVLGLEECRDEEKLNRALQKPLQVAAHEPVAFIVPGAVHELEVRVTPVPSSTDLDVDVRLDGEPIVGATRNAGVHGGVAVIPLQPLSVVELRLSGSYR